MTNLPKEFNISNQPWECPRCGRINAPFNPACFCNNPTVKIDSPYHSTAESIKKGNERATEFAKKFCEQNADLLKRMADI